MFDNIYCMPYSTSQLTTALVDGAEVRYLVAFYSGDTDGVCCVSCAAIHAGQSEPVAFSVSDHR